MMMDELLRRTRERLIEDHTVMTATVLSLSAAPSHRFPFGSRALFSSYALPLCCDLQTLLYSSWAILEHIMLQLQVFKYSGVSE